MRRPRVAFDDFPASPEEPSDDGCICHHHEAVFFDLAGELPARDMQGHECASRREARKHATFIAHRIGTERPGFAKGGNAIEVRDEDGERFFTAPIKSTLRGAE